MATKEEAESTKESLHESEAALSQHDEIHASTKPPAESASKSDEFDVAWLKGTSAFTELNKKAPAKKSTSAKYSDPAFKKISRINGKINTMSVEELTNSLKDLQMNTSGKKEVLSKRLKAYHKQKNLKDKNVSGEKAIELDYVCVIDYEATCSLERANYPHEIIEFPVVLINIKTLKIEDHFDAFCRPTINPKLTAFCTELTGITQEQVDKAELFPEVLRQVEQWLLDHELGSKYKFLVATDGPWDMQNFLNHQCAHSEILYPHWARRWIDVRKTFSNYFAVRRCNIERMLDYLGLTFEGKQHCGLHDSMNIATILIKMVEDGCRLEINGRIKNCLRPVAKNILKLGKNGPRTCSNDDQPAGAEDQPPSADDNSSDDEEAEAAASGEEKAQE